MSLFSFSKKTDYGFLFLSELIRIKNTTKSQFKEQSIDAMDQGFSASFSSIDMSAETKLSLSKFAQQSSLPLKFLEQIAGDLKRAGIVGSTEGRNGGYVLLKNPEKINLYEIISIFEGKVEHMECMKGESGCVFEGNCTVKHMWRGIGGEIENMLKSKSLSEINLNQK